MVPNVRCAGGETSGGRSVPGEMLGDLGRDALAARLEELGTGRMSRSEGRDALNELLALAQGLDRDDEAPAKTAIAPKSS
jgi:enolase